jgi:hypothetical protein
MPARASTMSRVASEAGKSPFSMLSMIVAFLVTAKGIANRISRSATEATIGISATLRPIRQSANQLVNPIASSLPAARHRA